MTPPLPRTPSTKREQLLPEIRRLRDDEGLTWREIGERLGVSLKTACDYYCDPTGDQARARKAKNNGRCVDCGGPTKDGGAKQAPERCNACAHAHTRAVSRRWVIESMQEWDAMFGAPPSSVDWNPSSARATGHCAWKAERYARTGRPWPSTTLVQSNFGSWNAGLVAAGFRPLAPSEWALGHAGRALRDEDRAAA